uniref:Reverse transcriptase Ty1/copia-type domain-containing protein n=1 Tax=Chromera velia CCMP2878 TaxID=1169474 RepID=A0A0G4HXJ6_9ALVE|eukprot:Cvel_9270.t1-p1 / transcript=Cvel_9270.t1 / gene=Cvel_9270 / organism=Chromera_velia_CCMP2878 / gene_product=hypothetical protein / transcript_product=hypothetical protein / location=Cvel_scaffold530:3988-5908(+) / protein_length=518 / sequence_SO=supercontig / SO=protein_coding / is_pseudo=false
MSPFFIGLSVLYHHPDHPRAKLAPLYTSATILQRISEHVFRLHLLSGRPILSHRRCIRSNDSPHPDPVYVVPLPSDSPSERLDTSVGSPHQAQQQQPHQSLDIQCPSDQPPSPKFNITDFGKDELILWRDENTGRCFLGSVRAVDPEGASVVYLWNEDTEVGPSAFQATTTHILLPRRGLTVEQLDGRAKFRAAELQSLADNDAYKRVPIAKVDAEHRRSAVPTHFIDTEKRVEEGSWIYKSCVIADSTPFFDRREEVTTSYATAFQSAMRIALAMAFAHSDFDHREIVVAESDVKTAYLIALRSDSLYIHPPKDHPDHGKFLWLLNRALYGLCDSGNLWDRSRNKTLAAAGWVPSSVRGMWWKWTGKLEAPSSRLLGILPTFVDNFAILPIGRSAVQLAHEIAAKGGYQMKITKPKNGTLHWAGVDFNVSRDSVHIHQTEYLLSLPLPEGMGDSVDFSASVPSSVPTPPPDLFPLPPSSHELPSKPPRLLTAQEGKAFRERLGCLSWVAQDTRPDLS